MDAAGLLAREQRAAWPTPALLDRLIDEVTDQRDVLLPPARGARRDRLAALLEPARARPDPTACASGWRPAASGEEAYTLAMLASEAFAPDPPPVSILATDISPARWSAPPGALRRGARCACSIRSCASATSSPGGDRLVVGRRPARIGRVQAPQPGAATLRRPRRSRVRPDRLPQRPDLLRRRRGRARDRLARACACAARDAGARRRGSAVRLRAPARSARRAGARSPAANDPARAERTLRRPLGRDRRSARRIRGRRTPGSPRR